MQVDVDFEVWKALTALRRSESVSYNDVLRELLDVGGTFKQAGLRSSRSGAAGILIAARRELPENTRLQGRYKGVNHEAVVQDRKIVLTNGSRFTSLSSAARSITGTNVNGLRFWRAKRPGDAHWTLVAGLPQTGDQA